MNARREIPTLHAHRGYQVPVQDLQPDDITPDGIVSDVQVMKSGVLVTFAGDVDRWGKTGTLIDVLARIVRD